MSPQQKKHLKLYIALAILIGLACWLDDTKSSTINWTATDGVEHYR